MKIERGHRVKEGGGCGGTCCNKACYGPCRRCEVGLKCEGEVDYDGNGRGVCTKGKHFKASYQQYLKLVIKLIKTKPICVIICIEGKSFGCRSDDDCPIGYTCTHGWCHIL